MIGVAALIELATALGTRPLLGSNSEVARRASRVRDIRSLFGNIASDLQDRELQTENFELSESDLMEELDGPPKASRILDFYSLHGVRLALERYGFLASLRKKGFADLRVQIDPSDPDQQRVAVLGSGDQQREQLLMELLVTRRSIKVPPIMEPKNEALNMLSVEWLLLQDPTKPFSKEKPQLPGQDYPGLGMFREVMEALRQSCRRLCLDGFVMHPSWFHVGTMGSLECGFLDPAIEGRRLALQEGLGTIDISKVSELLDHNLVVRHDGSAIVWEAEEFVAPVSERLRGYFSSADYAAERDLAREHALAAGIVRATNESRCLELRRSRSYAQRGSLAPRSFATEWQVDKLG